MGQRANLIVVENQTYTLYYDHWAANSLDSYLFWGPGPVVAFIRDHEKSGPEWWLDTVWCEGGAVVDLDNKVLLFFGGEDMEYEIPLRRMYFELLSYLWPGYDLRWAHHGVIDLAAYVGYNTELVRDKDQPEPPSESVLQAAFSADSETDLQGALSIVKDGQLYLYPIYGYIEADGLLPAGEELIHQLSQYKSESTFRYPDLSTESYLDYAKMGIHLDVDRQKLYYWTAALVTVPLSLLQTYWCGWEVVYLGDNYPVHATITQDRLIFSEVDSKLILKQIRDIVCRPYRRSDAWAEELIDKLAAAGEKVEVNSAIHATNLFDMPVKLREDIYDNVVAQWERNKD